MTNPEKTKVGIVGAGPAGCALACLLAQRRIACVVFDHDKRPDLLVGESLLPAMVPMLQRIGIEAEVARIAQRKPGVLLRHSSGVQARFNFRSFGSRATPYAYNIPRPAFDRLLRKRAEGLGVQFVSQRARVQVDTSSPASSNTSDRRVRLAASSLAAAGLNETQHPDILVDASGRHRVFSRLLELPSSRGKRDDVAYFAHFDQYELNNDSPGQIVISVMECGWSWQIPLRDTVSVGVVINKNAANHYGDNPGQRLTNIIEADAALRQNGRNRVQRSPVMCYSNYQIVSNQAYGANWVLMGDALGFTDPMLSPGVFMALKSAELMDQHVFSNSTFASQHLKSYSEEVIDWHRSWDELIEYFYDGRLLSLSEAGSEITERASRFSPARLIRKHLERVIAELVTGVGTRSRYNRAILLHSCNHLLGDAQARHETVAANSVKEQISDEMLDAFSSVCEDETAATPEEKTTALLDSGVAPAP